MSLLSRLAVQAARAYGMLVGGASTNVSADYLVVAGAGGGGGYNGGGGGGGGAGGYQTSTLTLSTLTTYSVTVGAGGAGGNPGVAGTNGSNSIFSTVTSTGGGGGGAAGDGTGAGKNGGSGGGGGSPAGTIGGGTGTAGQGNNGGSGTGVGSTGGGGGGGASAVGSNGSSGVGGNGGNGTASSISGSSVTYAGGGGGGTIPGTNGTGGTGGGASGGNANAGTANTGGGGGGGAYISSIARAGGAGGSGIVIISYTSATPKFVGGTITTSGGKQIHTFTSSGTLSPITPITASYLVVAGGAGGGSDGGGGGGAGGLLTSSTTLYSGATYIVTVGAGGSGGTASGDGSSGNNSTVSGTGLTTLTATGGGGGGGFSRVGVNGGSGGGGGMRNARAGGTGTSGQGFAGGTSSTGTGDGAAGGGGGSSAVGGNASGTKTAGNGGAGTASSISGTSTNYAGGGGGSTRNFDGTYTNGTGGVGGGGNGALQNAPGSPGTPNSGGGGGGGDANSTGAGGAGGSGIVIISYAGSQVFNGGLVTSSGGNTIHTFTSTGALTPLTNNLNNSLRFRSSASAYLSRTPASASNRKTWTLSMWFKLGALPTTDNNLYRSSSDAGANQIWVYFNSSSNNALAFGIRISSTNYQVQIAPIYRDPAAWYHLVYAVDTTQATSSNRAKIYINGQQVTDFVSSSYPPQNSDTSTNNTGSHAFGSTVSGGGYFDGYMTDINFIDGQALEPYYFGNNDANGVWKPIQYKGTYGTNGFYLNFADTSALTTSSNAGLGKDTSGNGNYWTTNNISITSGSTYDAMLDVPTNTSATVANYAVINPLDFISANGTISSANLNWASSASGCGNRATIGSTSGKWYWEAIGSSVTSGTVGGRFAFTGSDTIAVEQDKFGMYWHPTSGIARIVNGTNTYVTSAYTYTNSDVLALALDLDNNISYWYKNGVLQYTYDFSAYSTIGARVFFPYVWNASSGTPSWVYNFGQRAFAYTPPTGYVALNTYNLSTPTILQGNKYMDATLYTGTGTALNVVNAGQFKPDFVWAKNRSAADSSGLYDSVRGVNKRLISNSTALEDTSSGVSAFNSNGFSLGTAANYNTSGNNFVGWQWQAGQGSTSSGTGTGGITSVTMSVNATAGFSIVTYTGSGANGTVTHGLGAAPKMIIVKGRNTTSADHWRVYHSSLGATQVIMLNLTNAASTSSVYWNNTSPTSSVFSLGTDASLNENTKNFVAYCWAEIAGFSKFGSYTGNGSTDGVFVYTGFRPAYILIKRTSAIEDWFIFDNKRLGYNVDNNYLYTDLSNAEGTVDYIDMLSNGFKMRSTSTAVNSGDYIYMAFSENPFKNSNAR